MSTCELSEKCLFFNDRMENMPPMAWMLKQKYCHGNQSKCARRAVRRAVGPERVPADLTPSQMVRVRGLTR